MLDSGKVKAIGVSEVSPDQLRTIHSIVPVELIELEWSLFARECEVCAQLQSHICKMLISQIHSYACLASAQVKFSAMGNWVMWVSSLAQLPIT